MSIPVIIDADTGVDDAIAILSALGSDNLDIKAITAVAGNQTLDKTSINALKIVELAGRDIKVAVGADRPLVRELVTAAWVHGESGIGDVVLPDPTKDFYEKNAYDTIYEEAVKHNGELRLLAVGPLTNIALTLIKYPDIKDKIHSITIMGGAVYGGNHTPAAEFNIYVDPEAAKIVFESGIPLTMVGLDATHQALASEEDIKELRSYGGKVAEVVADLMTYTLKLCKTFKFDGAVLHDPLAAVALMDNSVLRTKDYYVTVETKGELTSGKTVADVYAVTGKEPNTHVGVGVDKERFIDIIKGTIRKYGS